VPSGSLTIEQVLTLLAETPPRIAALTAGLAPAQLHTAPNHDGWSANDVLAHLRACADVWGNCIVAMIVEDTPTLRAVNPRTLDQEDRLSRTGIPAIIALLYHAACRSLCSPGTVAARRLVTRGDSDGGGKGTRADRAVLCAVAGSP